MKKNYYFFSLLFIFSFLLSKNTSVAQDAVSKGYVVMNNNDSLSGTFNFEKIFSQKVIFSKGESSQTLVPENVIKIIFNDGFSITTTTIKRGGTPLKIFVKSILVGDVSLYEGRVENDYYYFLRDSRKNNNELRLINAINPTVYLKTLYPSIAKELNNYKVTYDKGSLIAAIEIINKSEDLGTRIKREKIYFEAGVGLNFTRHEVFVSDWFANDYNTKLSFMPAINFKILLPKRLSIFTGIHYNRRKLTSNKEIIRTYRTDTKGNTYYKYRAKPNITTSNLELPIIIRYDVIRKKDYYAGLGVGCLLLSNRKVTLTGDFSTPYETGKIDPNYEPIGSPVAYDITHQSIRYSTFTTKINYFSSFHLGKRIDERSAIEASVTYNLRVIEEVFFSLSESFSYTTTNIRSRRQVFSLNYYYQF
jgi:hypothetical protein